MEKKNYQFTQVPTNLFILLDNNCRSMLFTLIQLSTYYADEDGWFFRTYSDLEEESNLSVNLVMATLQTLFNHHLIEAKPVGYGKGKKPNYYKVNFDEFIKYEEHSIEDCVKNPDFKIRTVDYKGSNFKLNLVRETVNNTVTNLVKSENNIDNIENVDNKENVKNVDNKEDVKTKFKTECNEDFKEALKSTEGNENIEIADIIDKELHNVQTSDELRTVATELRKVIPYKFKAIIDKKVLEKRDYINTLKLEYQASLPF